MKNLFTLFLTFLSLSTFASDTFNDHIDITHTAEIHTALENGGSPVVVEVLGVVCDFCATAMNKVLRNAMKCQRSMLTLIRKPLTLLLRMVFIYRTMK